MLTDTDLNAALAGGDLNALAVLADTFDDAGHPERGAALRALALGPAGPELAAWRGCVLRGQPTRGGRMRIVPAGGAGMARATAQVFDRLEGCGPRARLLIRTATGRSWEWYSPGTYPLGDGRWEEPPLDKEDEADRADALRHLAQA